MLSIAPDGRHLLVQVADSDEACLTSLDGLEDRTCTPAESTYASHVGWDTDSDAVAFVRGNPDFGMDGDVVVIQDGIATVVADEGVSEPVLGDEDFAPVLTDDALVWIRQVTSRVLVLTVPRDDLAAEPEQLSTWEVAGSPMNSHGAVVQGGEMLVDFYRDRLDDAGSVLAVDLSGEAEPRLLDSVAPTISSDAAFGVANFLPVVAATDRHVVVWLPAVAADISVVADDAVPGFMLADREGGNAAPLFDPQPQDIVSVAGVRPDGARIAGVVANGIGPDSTRQLIIQQLGDDGPGQTLELIDDLRAAIQLENLSIQPPDESQVAQSLVWTEDDRLVMQLLSVGDGPSAIVTVSLAGTGPR